jgi:hypothetical protein
LFSERTQANQYIAAQVSGIIASKDWTEIAAEIFKSS